MNKKTYSEKVFTEPGKDLAKENNWTDKSEQAKAEWLAENVLNMKKYEAMGTCGAHWETSYGVEYRIIKLETGRELEEFIYSPDGFFAMWDAVEKKRDGEEPIFKKVTKVAISFLSYNINIPGECSVEAFHGNGKGKGKDRYEAFYNAVYEAMKDE